MAARDNRETLRRLLEEIQPSGDSDALDQYYHPDVILPGDVLSGQSGLAGLKALLKIYDKAVKSVATVEDMVGDGDRIAVRIRHRGTQIGEFLGLPATGRSFDIEEMLIVEFRDGRISQCWRVSDMMALMQQLGGST